MINKLVKKIGFICLGFASLALAGCFHVPDKDWLPSKNKASTGNIEKENEIDEALNSFMEGIYMFPSERDQLNNDKNDNGNSEDGNIDSIEPEDKTLDNSTETTEENEEENIESKDDAVNNESEDENIDENIITEE